MDDDKKKHGMTEEEIKEWTDSIKYVLKTYTKESSRHLLEKLQLQAREYGVTLPFTVNTPYINTIPHEKQPTFPGNLEIERRIESIVRWNAMDMVVRANKKYEGIGGHLSTYASSATLYEVGFNHFFRAPKGDFPGDFVYFQGHASPGVYSRAFLEGRFSERELLHFRREAFQKGLSSYPHPRLMPNFWQFSTVCMGLAPLLGIYHARFNRYLEDRKLKKHDDSKVWVFMGDGESDEPESLGSIGVASREELDNLIFVINCNLQRLDGPVRGNSKIIQELEAIFRGAGWNVIKLIWGREWDELLAKDTSGLLAKRMEEVVDGEYQRYSAEDGTYFRKHFFGKYPELLSMVKHLTDDQLKAMKRGGHDTEKVYAAYKAAVEFKGAPTVILAKTIKGYGLGEAGEGKNISHQEKKLSDKELKDFRTRFNIPLDDKSITKASFLKFEEDSVEMKYLLKQREKLGGFVPQRTVRSKPIKEIDKNIFNDFNEGSDREVTTTGAYVRMLVRLMSDKDIGKLIVPIVPDEARTLGMDALFQKFGIYSHVGQKYEPVDIKNILYYKEASDGQFLEEGITEAGSMASFIAAGMSYMTQGISAIPFYTYYSMFGFQRVGDLVWAAADMCTRGFLVGGISGRTSLPGEGLQHQDGHSHVLFSVVPNCIAYTPAFAYEIAVIILEGIRRMYEKQENVFYYITVGNEAYPMIKKPKGSNEGIIKGIYNINLAKKKRKAHVNFLGDGAMVNLIFKAQEILEKEYDVSSNVWSVTSYTELRKDAIAAERWNLLNPTKPPKTPYVTQCLKGHNGLFVAVSDYMRTLSASVSQWIPGDFISLGTDGFGRSDTREELRKFFEVDPPHIVYSALVGLYRKGKIDKKTVEAAAKKLSINPDKPDPAIS